MLIVHIRRHFRPRSTEWMLACGMVSWGVSLIIAPAPLAGPPYPAIEAWASPAAWGWGCLAVGIVRLAALTINGALRPSPHARCLLALVSGLWWIYLTVALVASGWTEPTLAIYPAAALFDLLNLAHTADDAGAVDRDART